MTRILLVFLMLPFFSSIHSQKVSHDHLDGAIYIKIKNSSEINWPGLFVIENKEEFPYWTQWHNEYHIVDIRKPFSHLKTKTFDRTYEVRFEKAEKVTRFIEDIKQLSFVEYVEPKDIFRLNYTPNDPKTNLQYALNTIDAYSAFDIHKGGNAVIAIVDDAVLTTHEDILPNLWTNPNEIPNNNIDDDNNGYRDDINGWDAADNDNDPNPPSSASSSVFTHGTHCAGIASAATDNSKGIASIGFNCKIMPVKSSTSNGNAQYIDAGYDGIAYAMAAGADVISMSWGGNNYSQTAQNIFNQAHNLGITLVAAAGNDASSQTFYPAGYNYVISVASTDQSDNLSSFTNYGSTIDVCAPGSSIYSCVASGPTGYSTKSGTSMACPLVAGLCGLLKSLDNNLSPDDIENCLKVNADNIDAQNNSYIGQMGSGRINAYNSIQCVNPTVPPSAEFYYSPIEDVCPGTLIQFYDATTYNPDTWQWSFPGGSPPSSNDQSPIVSYSTYGSYDIELIVTNSYGSDTILKTSYVNVSTQGKEVFYTEDFENGIGQWTAINPDQSNEWSVYTVGGTSGGSKAAGINLFNYGAGGEIDGLESPSFDFRGRYNIRMDFDHAHRRSTSNKSDSLLIYVSTDNGQSYPYLLFGGAENGTGNFATNYIYNNEFTPIGLDDWCYTGSVGSGCFDVDLSQFGGMNNIKIKFVSVSDGGNNIYIDNIRLTSTCELTEGTLIADLAADFNSGCTPLTANFSDISISMPEVSEWFWVFPGGQPAISTHPNPTVDYNTTGLYDVMLIVSNGSGSDTVLKEDYITVSDTGSVLVLSQDFESGFGEWTYINSDNDEGWEITDIAGSKNGLKAASVQFFNYNPGNGQRDQLISPLLDLSEASNLVLSFDHAARAYNSNYTDSLLIYLSTDSGNSYTHRLFGDSENGSGNYATGNFQEDGFIPEEDSDWCYGSSFGSNCFSFNLDAYEGEKAVRLMFETVNGYGNNHYIDNINISGSCAVSSEPINESQVKVFPNPMQDFSVIDFGNLKPDNYLIFDLSGRLIKDVNIISDFIQIIYRDNMPEGLYIIELKKNKESLYKGKLMLM